MKEGESGVDISRKLLMIGVVTGVDISRAPHQPTDSTAANTEMILTAAKTVGNEHSPPHSHCFLQVPERLNLDATN